jgi:phosphoribosyl 1,2-cyclic phosphodiesterase
MKVSILASGSRGNAILIRKGGHCILIDFGVSVRKLKTRLNATGNDLNGLQGVFVSHEHTDHIYGLEIFSKEYKGPVFATAGTWEAIKIPALTNRVSFKCGEKIGVNGFEVQGFRIHHDAREPAGFIIENDGCKIGVCTDLGIATALVEEKLKGMQLLVLESNHDRELLLKGPYPWPLKQRILGRDGHLSNKDCAKLLSQVQSDELKNVVLAHISDKNNTGELAYRESRETLGEATALHITNQSEPGPVIQIK